MANVYKPYANERKVAIDAVLQACKLTKRVQDMLITEDTITKKDRSPVTVADFGAQALILHALARSFPEDSVIAEESGKVLAANPTACDNALKIVQEFIPEISKETMLKAIDRGANRSATTKRWWTLDPVDGTLGFLRREQYAVCLALMEDNRPVLGVLGCPSLPLSLSSPSPAGVLLVAVKGHGAYWRGLNEDDEEKEAHTSPCADPAAAIFTESVETSHTAQDVTGDIRRKTGATAEPARLDSQCKYAVVALGQTSVYLRFSGLSYKEKIWDHAAGVLIVQEAGGKVNDMEGKSLDFSVGHTLSENVGIVATNGALHTAVMDAVAAINPVGEARKAAASASAASAAH